MGGRIRDAWLACCAALILHCSMTLDCAFLLPAHQLMDSASSAYHMHCSHCALLYGLAALPGHCGRECAACAARADPPRTWGWRRACALQRRRPSSGGAPSAHQRARDSGCCLCLSLQVRMQSSCFASSSNLQSSTRLHGGHERLAKGGASLDAPPASPCALQLSLWHSSMPCHGRSTSGAGARRGARHFLRAGAAGAGPAEPVLPQRHRPPALPALLLHHRFGPERLPLTPITGHWWLVPPDRLSCFSPAQGFQQSLFYDCRAPPHMQCTAPHFRVMQASAVCRSQLHIHALLWSAMPCILGLRRPTSSHNALCVVHALLKGLCTTCT